MERVKFETYIACKQRFAHVSTFSLFSERSALIGQCIACKQRFAHVITFFVHRTCTTSPRSDWSALFFVQRTCTTSPRADWSALVLCSTYMYLQKHMRR